MQLRLAAVVQSAVKPALALLSSKMDSKEARVMLLAIGLQESKFTARVQLLNNGGRGPAHGLWQMEQGGGVLGVIRHEATKQWAAGLCAGRGCDFTPAAVWARIETDDVLAAGFARLLLYSDSKPLPGVHETEAARLLYERTWRPGKPHWENWDTNHLLAQAEVMMW